MGAPKALLRVYSYIFELLLIVACGAISCFASYNHTPLNLPFLPWTGHQLVSWLFYSALVGLFTLVLAVAGKLRGLFFLWSLAVFVMLFRGFFLTSYSFAGPVHFKTAAYLTVFALVAAIGAWPSIRRREPIRRPMKY